MSRHHLVTRRKFVRDVSALALGAGFAGSAPTVAVAGDEGLLTRIEAHRPSRLSKLPADFSARFGSTHVGGKYCLTEKPFLIEGAERLLSLGTRLGKFWFEPGSPHTEETVGYTTKKPRAQAWEAHSDSP